LSCRLPPRSSRCRWTRPELASSGARGVSCELRVALAAVERADLGEQLGGGDSSAARLLEQRRRCLGGPLFELTLELSDRARERATAGDELAGEPYLQLLLATGKPTADTFQVG
jgi:hypothetical protein